MEVKSNKAGNHRHTLMMMLGCLMPLLILGILWVVGVSQSILSFGIILLCPILHFIMMKNMKHENVKQDSQKIESKIDSENKKEELV